MTRDDYGGHSSVSNSPTHPSPRDASNVRFETARSDNLAAIMRDSTIILDAQTYPVGEVYFQRPIGPQATASPVGRRDAERAPQERPPK